MIKWKSIALLVSFPLLLLWPFFLQGKVLFWGTPIVQFYPWRNLAVSLLSQNALPFWNPFAGSGSPLLANHQTAVLYPLFNLYFLLPVERALTLDVSLHLALAGIFMYFCALGFGLRDKAAILAGLAYMGNGYIVSRLHFPTMVNTLAWLPMAILLTRKLCQKPCSKTTVALGVIVAAQFLAGHAQLWTYTLFLALLLVLWESTVGKKGSRPAACFLASLVLGILLAAIQFIPTAEFAVNSGRKGGIPEEIALTYSLWPWKIISFLLPDFFGNPAKDGYWGYANYWEDCAYTGVLVFVLMALALSQSSQKRLKLFLLIIIALAFLLALGKNTPFYPFLYRHLPGLDLFRAPSRFLILYSFAASLLSGFGAQAVMAKPFPPATLKRVGAGIVGLFVAAIVAKFLPEIKPSFARSLLIFALASAGAGFALHLFPRKPFLSLLLLEAELLAYGWGFHPFTDPALFHLPTSTSEFLSPRLQSELFRLYTFGPDDYHLKYKVFFRFDRFGPSSPDYWMKLRETLIPQTNMIAGAIYHAGIFDPLTVGKYGEFLELVDRLPQEQALKLLGLLNVRYIVEPTSPESPEVRLWENPYFLPRVRLAYQAISVPKGEELKTLSAPDFDPRIVLLSDAAATASLTPGEKDTVTDLHYGAGIVKIKCVLEKGGYLVLSETFYPGWRVWVNARPVPLLRAYHTLMAVKLEGGEHEVVFRFDPTSFKLGLGLTIGALMFVASFIAGKEAQARRGKW